MKMVRRALVIAFCLFVAIVGAGFLVYQEVIPDGQLRQQIQGFDEPLRRVSYRATNRNSNFVDMGLPQPLADEVTAEARKLDEHKKRLAKLIEEQALDIGKALCPNPGKLPQPYAAMEYLVVQDGGERSVVNARKALFEFEQQSWYATDSNVPGVYERLERTQRRRPDASLMGVAAILAMREADAINERGPWAKGLFGGSFETLESENPSIRIKTVQYFALVHVLTEIANDPDGICAR